MDTSSAGQAPAKPSSGRRRLIVLMAAVAALVVATIFLPVKDYLLAMLDWTSGLGVWGPAFVAAFYVAACVLLLPGSVLTLGAGFLFGVVTGTVTVSIGSTLGACAAFVVGRTLARGWIEQKVAARPKFAAIDRAVGVQGFKIVLLTRLSPIFPFNLLNYAYGLTKVKFWQYALASWVGMLPGTVMYVYLGSGLRSLTEAAAGQSNGPLQRILFFVGLGVTVVVVVLVTHLARKALRAQVGAAAGEDKGVTPNG